MANAFIFFSNSERKAGEFLKGMEKTKGSLLRGNMLLPREKELPSLKDMGIEKMESVRWQKAAHISNEKV